MPTSTHPQARGGSEPDPRPRHHRRSRKQACITRAAVRGAALLLALAAAGCAGEDRRPDAASADAATAEAVTSQLVPGEPLAADTPLPASSTASPQSGVELLFSGGSGSLTAAEKVRIFELLELTWDPARAGLLLDGICGQPVGATARLEDLNGDGTDEVFVVLESVCLYGGTGVGTTLFVRDRAGSYGAHLGFPGTVERVLATRRHGFPDLLIAGMTDCFAVWGWTGSAYEHVRNEPQAPGACDHLPE